MYLDKKITEFGVNPDDTKIFSITKYPVPSSQRDIKSYLLLAGYDRRFIPNFSK